MIEKLIINGARAVVEKYSERLGSGLVEIVRPPIFEGYRINYSYPVSKPCPGCGHTTYHTNDPEVAFCPCCRRTLYIIE